MRCVCNIILLGPPGAGKGTQAQILASSLSIRHIASGELFRRQAERGTPLGLKAKEYMNSGVLVPDDLTTSMVLEELFAPEATNGALLDGFPRTLNQALVLDKALEEHGYCIQLAICIRVSRDELIKRLGGRLECRRCHATYHRDSAPPKVPERCNICGGELYTRADDKPEAVVKRLEVYERETRPLIGHYRAQDRLVEVDGAGPVDEVAQRILQAINMGRGKGGCGL